MIGGMFEIRRKQASELRKVLPLAGVVFLAVVGSIVYLAERGASVPEVPEGILRDGSPDFDWYSKYVELTDTRVQMGESFAGKPIAIFSGIIENNGERALDVIELKMAFYNYDELLWETLRIPIRPGGRTPPIKTFERRGFTIYIENLSEDWHATTAEVSINGFRFAERRRG